jgi:PAS domain S-box-containing protein
MESSKPRKDMDDIQRWKDSSRILAERNVSLVSENEELTRQLAELKIAEERRRVSEDQLKDSEARLRQVIDAIPSLSWCNLPDGPNEFLSKSWHEYTGLSPEEAQGWGWQSTFHSEDLPPLMTKWQELLISGDPGEIEARIRRHDGNYRWFLVKVAPHRNEAGTILRWYGTSTDINDRKQAEQALRDSERDIRLIVDTIPGLVCTLKANWEVETVNRPLREYFGKTLDELKDWEFIGVVHPDDLERVVAETHRSVQNGQPYEVEHRCRRHDGVFRWFQVRCNPLRGADGQIVRWYLLLTDIEDRKVAEEALRASERNLSLAINSMPVLVWSARPDGSVKFFSKSWLEYTGLAPEDALGWGWTSAFHPEDLPGLSNYWRSITASGEPGEYEARLCRWDGQYRWFLLRANPLRDESGQVIAWYGSNTDIEDRKLAEEALRERELNLRQITETIPEMLWSASPDGSIDYCNGRLLEFTGFTPDEVRGRGWIRLLHPDDVAHAVEAWTHCVRTGDPYRVEVRTIHALDNTYRLCVTRALPLFDSEGCIVKWHGTVVDMHDWKVAQEELRNTQAELAKVMRVMTMGQLTASIAHEVNQPLSGIITNANTCLRMLSVDPPNIEGARETALRTIRDGNRASDVITRLRSLFGKKPIANEPIDLNEAAREVIALQMEELQRNGVMVRHEFQKNLPMVRGDRVQIQQVILNLVRNASDAMKDLTDRPRLMLVKTERGEEDDIRLAVEDRGPGFDPGAATRLFEPFYTTKSDGMGIGLSLSRSIVEAHQGRMWAAANREYGASFTFSIPCISVPQVASDE